MAFDYKKEYKEFYLPKKTPQIIEVPAMNYIAVHGQGNPNDEDGDYQHAIQLLYSLAYTIKMSKKTSYQIEGYFDYVVPPLEGLWWMADSDEIDLTDKSQFQWISMIRLPDFVREDDFQWAVREATQKKKMDFSSVTYFTLEEGLCVQCMHIGPYDDEPETISQMHAYAKAQGYAIDITPQRRHHEIYLSDARRTKPSSLKTVIRLPVKPA